MLSLFHDGGPYHIETSPLISSANFFVFSKFTFFKFYFAVEGGLTIRTSAIKRFRLAALIAVYRPFISVLNLMLLLLFFLNFSIDFQFINKLLGITILANIEKLMVVSQFPMHKKLSFPLGISSVNMNKFAGIADLVTCSEEILKGTLIQI